MISYNVYWIVVIIGFLFLGWKERKASLSHTAEVASEASSEERKIATDKAGNERAGVNTAVREI